MSFLHPTNGLNSAGAGTSKRQTSPVAGCANFSSAACKASRAVFQREYAEAFDGAGRVVVAAPPAGPIYSATGEVHEFFSVHTLAEDLRRRGVDAVAHPGVDAIVADLAHSCRAGDVVLVMSNGGFGNIWERLLDAFRAAA